MNWKNVFIWIGVFGLLIVVANSFQSRFQKKSEQEFAFSDFMTAVEKGTIKEATMQGQHITGKSTDGKSFSTYGVYYEKLLDMLRAKNVTLKVKPEARPAPTFMEVMVSWFPMLLLIGVWIFIMRQMGKGGGAGGPFGFGKSKAKMLEESKKKITFQDVAGVDEAKQDVEEIVEFLKSPHKFERLGGKIPKGILMVGAPGTGKTLLARAIAGEAGVPFFSISGSDFVEMFVGVGASRVRDLFEQGKKHAPCIIFIDEIDAVGRHRGAGLGGGNDEREQTLNQLLVEMDGFEGNSGVILIAATNRPDVLDPALLRPGRFDRQVVVPMPDLVGREKILVVHAQKVQLAPDVNLQVVARGTPGFSGADLENLVNEAALIAARHNKRKITATDFEYAKDKIMMGSERRSLMMSEEEKKLTAYHEAGHAVCALHEKESDPIHKATIMPRGRALGMVMRLPERDSVSYPRAKIMADLTVSMGGRVAEEMIFGPAKVTTGASSDIKHATDLARRMVTEWGMSDKLGPIAYDEPDEEIFLGHAITRRKNISDETALLVDQEIRKIVDAAHERAKAILKKSKKELENLAKALLTYETLTGDEIKLVVAGKKLVTKEKEMATPARKSSVPVMRTPPPSSEEK